MLRVIIALLVIIAGAVIWLALPESCAHWQAREDAAFQNALFGSRADNAEWDRIRAERPAGCK